MEELLLSVYNEIKSLNEEGGFGAVPRSDEFYPQLVKKFGLFPHMVPVLINILVKSHMIFNFNLIEEDRKGKILRVESFVIAKGDLIKKLRLFFEDDLMQVYTREFTAKSTPDKIVREILNCQGKYNNTKIGMLTNTVTMLTRYELELEQNISDYSKTYQEKIFKEQVARYNVATFTAKNPGAVKSQTKIKDFGTDSGAKDIYRSKRVSEGHGGKEAHSIEKTIAVYGVGFYTRLCFRDYNFKQLNDIISEGVINTQEDLHTVKRLLAKERANSDQDTKLQSFAGEINELEHLINQKLKS